MTTAIASMCTVKELSTLNVVRVDAPYTATQLKAMTKDNGPHPNSLASRIKGNAKLTILYDRNRTKYYQDLESEYSLGRSKGHSPLET